MQSQPAPGRQQQFFLYLDCFKISANSQFFKRALPISSRINFSGFGRRKKEEKALSWAFQKELPTAISMYLYGLANGLPQIELCVNTNAFYQKGNPLWALGFRYIRITADVAAIFSHSQNTVYSLHYFSQLYVF